jgi:hypothetical protein
MRKDDDRLWTMDDISAYLQLKKNTMETFQRLQIKIRQKHYQLMSVPGIEQNRLGVLYKSPRVDGSAF